MNPAEWLARSAALHPGAPALMRGAEVLADYAGFARQAAGLGAALAARGLGPGSRVAVFMTNRPEYLIALYAVWWAGAAVVPINAKLHVREAEWIIANAGAGAVILSEDVGADLRPEGAARLSVDAAEFAGLLARDPLPAPAPMTGAALAWLFYTSGTTGRPKGVQITAANLVAMVLSYLADVDAVHPTDAAFYAAPMSHGAGLYNFMHVIRGARHVVPPSGGFDAAEILELAPRLGDLLHVRRPHHGAPPGGRGEGARGADGDGPPHHRLWRRADVPGRYRGSGEVMGPRFVQIYGQGESPMTITALSRDLVADRSHPDWRARLASVGRAFSALEVRIAGADGRTLPPGAVGEILVRGPTVMPGYWQNPQASAETLRGGWLWTGDMGAMDAAGFVTLHDRSKDVIISGGTNIYPREVEEALLPMPLSPRSRSSAARIPTGARRSWPSSSASRGRGPTRPRSTPIAGTISPASNGRSSTASCPNCRRTTTARS
jgi:acyl-CoA synthetase (AMP-forming)/AMP-acid ligase II